MFTSYEETILKGGLLFILPNNKIMIQTIDKINVINIQFGNNN